MKLTPFLIISILFHLLIFFNIQKKAYFKNENTENLQIFLYDDKKLVASKNNSPPHYSDWRKNETFDNELPNNETSKKTDFLKKSYHNNEIPSLKILPPEYPHLSQLKGEEGSVTILLELTTEKKLANLEIYESSGYILLDIAALNSIKKSIPSAINTHQKTIKKFVKINFRLKSGIL